MVKRSYWWAMGKWNSATLYWVSKEWQQFYKWRVDLMPKYIPPWWFSKTMMDRTPFEGWVKIYQGYHIVLFPGSGWVRGFLRNGWNKKGFLCEWQWLVNSFLHGQLWCPCLHTGFQRSCVGNKWSNSGIVWKFHGCDSTTWFVHCIKNKGGVKSSFGTSTICNRQWGAYYKINQMWKVNIL